MSAHTPGPWQSVTVDDHARLLAIEVIDAAYQRYLAGEHDDLPANRDAVIAERWPCRGTGGVAMAQRQTVAKVRAAIREFYEPSELPEINT